MTDRRSPANAFVRHAIALTVGLAVLGCNAGASSAPASSASPSAADVSPSPLPSASGSPRPIDPYAKALVAKLATKPLIVHVDQTTKATQTSPTSSGTTNRADLQVTLSEDFSGDDVSFHAVSTTAGQTDEQDIVVVGDTAYSRIAGGAWTKTPRSTVAKTIDDAIKTIRLTSDPAELTYVGPETVDGRQLRHLTGTGKVLFNAASGGVGKYDAFDIWVTDDGTPVLAKTTFSASDATGSQVAGSNEFHYSKVGGPIEIAAPSVAP
jgi:hypothetical protein